MRQNEIFASVAFADRFIHYVDKTRLGNTAESIYSYDILKAMKEELPGSEFVELSHGDTKACMLVVKNFYGNPKRLLNSLMHLYSEYPDKNFDKRKTEHIYFTDKERDLDIINFTHLSSLHNMKIYLINNFFPNCELVTRVSYYNPRGSLSKGKQEHAKELERKKSSPLMRRKCTRSLPNNARKIHEQSYKDGNVLFGLCIGSSFMFSCSWYKEDKQIANETITVLYEGDLWIMSENTTGIHETTLRYNLVPLAFLTSIKESI